MKLINEVILFEVSQSIYGKHRGLIPTIISVIRILDDNGVQYDTCQLLIAVELEYERIGLVKHATDDEDGLSYLIEIDPSVVNQRPY